MRAVSFWSNTFIFLGHPLKGSLSRENYFFLLSIIGYVTIIPRGYMYGLTYKKYNSHSENNRTSRRFRPIVLGGKACGPLLLKGNRFFYCFLQSTPRHYCNIATFLLETNDHYECDL